MNMNKNARVIIPLAIVAWLLATAIFTTGAPPVFELVFVVALFIVIPVAVFYLMAEQGWSTLAKRYRSAMAFSGAWQACPTGQMALVSVDHPDFTRMRLRLISTLRVGTTPEALHLSMLFSKVPLLGRFFPDVAIPWSQVQSARAYEAPGWVQPQSQPGAILQMSYDPNYRGTFVEMGVGEPPVYIQLPLPILGDNAARIGLSQPG